MPVVTFRSLSSALMIAGGLGLAALPASASVSPEEMIQYGMPPGLASHAASVSASEGNWDSVNQHGCAGAFQFCPATRSEYYSGSRSDFINDPSAQVDAWLGYQDRQWELASNNGYTDLIGQEICHGGQCGTVTASGILKACQFGCAQSGALGNFYRTGNCNDPRSQDGNNVSACRFLLEGSGNNVEDVTGMPEEDIPQDQWDLEEMYAAGETGAPMVLMRWEVHAPKAPMMIPGELVR